MNLSDIQTALDTIDCTDESGHSEQLRRLISALTEEVTRLSDDLRYAHARLDGVDSHLENRQ